ncbi:hypothetical protein PX699_00270 [Sphingobium sp. H39-3-25]|uniref:hypothetical protein n=1 Tax=Sphingobium arseniciresistens TaxID=3030834 RepID=UPI0023B9989D|nr:hypothetical protein [Sphingobium arseniciresistens]
MSDLLSHYPIAIMVVGPSFIEVIEFLRSIGAEYFVAQTRIYKNNKPFHEVRFSREDDALLVYLRFVDDAETISMKEVAL